MNDIKHHLSDALLMSYAGGGLNEAFSLVVASHIEMCDECRARIGSFEAIGGSLLETVTALGVSDENNVDLDATLALIDAAPMVNQAAPAIRKPGLFPSALQEYVGGDLALVKWRPVGRGVRQAILPTSKEATVRLLHIPAGCAVPDHGHQGMELTLVLQGAFTDETARFGVGDLEIATQEDEHTPVAEAGLDCICLAATDAPLKFSGLLPRIAQPFLNI